jgi:septal ring factor EnvC (AmiA/AmiB activator)
VAQLKKKESNLRADIVKKKKKATELNSAIESIIRKEIELARKRAEDEARKEAAASKGETTAGSTKPNRTTTSATPTMTPEATALSNSFSSNQGALPWPVERGVITEYFGSHAHPVLDGVMINNNGIDITTDAGSGVRAIFEGTVSSVVSNPSFQNAIIIKHGEYFSVYSNVTNVQVRAGDKVKTKQRIGTVHTNADNQSEMHLEIWRGTNKLNPSSWVAR